MREQWRLHGLTPGELLDRVTPSEFLALFTNPPPARLDPLAELIRLNRERGGRGERPVIPAWL